MLADLRFAFRQLTKHPGLTIVAVLTLTLGIGANTAIFSVLHSVVLDPLPYPQPDRLVGVFETVPDGGRNSVSGGAFKDWAEHSTSFESLALVEDVQCNLTGEGEPERVDGLRVTADYLSVLGVQPSLGRDFAAGEDRVGGDNKVLILTHGYWQRRFGGDPTVLGRTVALDQEQHAIVGVLPPEVLVQQGAQFLIPTVIDGDPEAWRRVGHWRTVVGRLQADADPLQAQAELRAIKERLQDEYPAFKKEWSVSLVPLQDVLGGQTRPTLVVLLSMVALVLLIACANVANLLLARGQARGREMAVRTALGAHRWRIVRQMLVESLVLAAAGCIGGLVVASFAIDLLAGTLTADLPQVLRPRLDGQVLAFSILVTVVSGLLFGVLPALKASQTDPNAGLKDSERGSTSAARKRSQSFLVAAEVAFTVILVVFAGLFLKSFAAVLQVDPGFEPKNALAFDLSLPSAKYPEAEDRLRMIGQLTQSLQALPGVEAAAASSHLPLSNSNWTEFASRVDREPTTDYVVGTRFVSGDFVAAMGMRLLRGRTLSAQDNQPEAKPVIVVDAGLVHDLFPDENPLGRRLRFMGQEREIVGVVAPVRYQVLDQDPIPAIYLPQRNFPWNLSMILRTSVPPETLVEAVRDTVRVADPEQPIANVRTLEQAVYQSLQARRTTLILLGMFAAVAVFLACIGVYGVMSYLTGQRARELSLHAVFGAQRRDVLTMVLRDSFAPSALGLAVGLAGALALGRLVQSLLFGIGSTDPGVLLASLVGVTSLVLVATLIPASRAADADPSLVLRCE